MSYAVCAPERDRLDELVVRADARGVILYISSACQMLGYQPEDVLGRIGAEFVHPEDRARFITNTMGLFAHGGPDARADREHRFRCKDGSYRWLEGHPMVQPSPDGRLGDVVNVFRDVTEHRAMREALRAQVRAAAGQSSSV